MVYDAVGNVVETTDELGRTTSFTFDGLDRLVEVALPAPTTGAGRPVVRYGYDVVGNRTNQRDPLDRVTSYTFDDLNRVVATTDAAGQVSRVTYDAVGNVVTSTDRLGRVTTFEYDALDRLVRRTDPDPDAGGPQAAPVTRWAYDANGNLTRLTDGRGNPTQYVYDQLDRRIEVIDAAGSSTGFTYDSESNVVATTDALGRVTSHVYDGLGRIVTTTLPDPDAGGPQQAPVLRFVYDAAGNLVSTFDALGRQTQFTYDALNRRVSTRHPLGVQLTGYDAAGRVVSRTDEAGRVTTFVHDALDRLVSVTRPDPDGAGPLTSPVTTHTYDLVGNQLSSTDPLGRVTRVTYDGLDRVVTVTDALGGVSSVGYDAEGNIVSSSDALGRVTVSEYDGLNRRVKLTQPDPDGPGPLPAPVWRFGYDALGNLTTTTDPRGRTTGFTYDVLNRRTRMTDAIGGVTQTVYDAVGNVVAGVDALGRTTSYDHDDLDRLVTVTQPDPDGAGPKPAPVRTYDYDLAGNLVRTTDPLGHATTFGYDDLNRRTSVTDALSGVSSVTYDLVGNVVSATDPLGRITVTEYDALNRRTVVHLPDPDGAIGPRAPPTLRFDYDAVGNLVATTDPNGNVTRFDYDSLNRPTSVTDALLKVTSSVYDAVGNLVSVTDALGRTTQYTYDRLNRRISTRQPDPDGSGPQAAAVTTYAYDELGNLVTTTDPLGHTWRREYDQLDRLVRAIDANGSATRYAYDGVGNLLSVTDALNNATSYAYDALSRLVEETDPFGAKRHYTYDAAGRVTEKTDALGRVTRYAYDALGRATGETWIDRAGVVVNNLTRTFDAAGQLRTVTDATATYTLDYDGLGRVTRVDNAGSPGLVPVALTYGHDPAGNLVSVAAAVDGAADWTTTYTYDALNRVVAITQSGGRAVQKRATFEFDAAGQLLTVSRFASAGPADVVSTYTWDAAGRLASIRHANGSGPIGGTYQFTWDAAGRLGGMTSADGAAVFGYDANGQLTVANYSYQAAEMYGYDANGNRIPSVLEAANRVVDDGTFTYAYDAEGNRIRRTDKATGAVDEYTWDHRNRLVGVTRRSSAGAVVASETMRYDDFGNKILRVADQDGTGPQSARTEQYVHDRGNVAMVLRSGTTAELYLHGPGLDNLLAEQDGAQLRWLLSDHTRTVRDVTDAAGTLLNHLRYDSFGQVTGQTNAAVVSRYGFTGRELDRLSGLMDYRARWYEPRLGRFLSVDPIGFSAGDPNLYRYVLNRPTSLVDPTGHQAAPASSSWIAAQRWFAEAGDTMADYLVPGRSSIPSGPNASPWAQLARDLTNPGLLAEQVVGGVIGVAKSFAKVVGGVVDLVKGIPGAVKWLADGKLGEWAADTYESIQNRLAAACGDFFRAAVTGYRDLKKLAGAAADKWWTELERKTLSGDMVGAAADAAEVAADVAQVIVPVAASAATKVGKVFQTVDRGRDAATGLEAMMSAGRALKAESAAVGSAQRYARAATRAEELAAAAKSGNLERLQRATQEVLELGVNKSKAAAELFKRAGGAFDYSDVKAAVQNLGVKRYRETKALLSTDPAAYHQVMKAAIASEQEIQALQKVMRSPVSAALKSLVDTVTEAPRALVGWAVKGTRFADEVSPVLGRETAAFAEAAARLKGAGNGVAAVEVQVRKVPRLTKSVLEFASEFNVPTKPEYMKAKTFFGLAPQEGWLSALAHAPHQILGQGFGRWLAKNFYRGDVDLYAVTKVMRNGERIALANDEILRFGMEVNRGLAARGVVPTVQHGAHAAMGYAQGGYVSFSLEAKIGAAKGVASQTVGGGGRITAWRGVYLTDVEAAAMARDLAAGRPILTNATRNGLSAADWDARGLEWAQRQHGDRAWIARASREEQLAAFHVDGSSPDSMGISFTANRNTAEEWAIRMNQDPSKKPYLIRADFELTDQIVRQRGYSYGLGSEYEVTLLGDTYAREAALYEISGTRSTIHGGTTYRPVAPTGPTPSGPSAPIVVVTGPGSSTTPAIPVNAPPLVVRDALELVEHAAALWLTAAGSLPRPQLNVSIADLPAGELGRAYITQLDAAGRPSEGRIVLDWNGDDRGWFVDPTPLDASEFRDPTSAAFGRYDLFSVLVHEIGHVLGFLRGYDGFDQHVVVVPERRAELPVLDSPHQPHRRRQPPVRCPGRPDGRPVGPVPAQAAAAPSQPRSSELPWARRPRAPPRPPPAPASEGTVSSTADSTRHPRTSPASAG